MPPLLSENKPRDKRNHRHIQIWIKAGRHSGFVRISDFGFSFPFRLAKELHMTRVGIGYDVHPFETGRPLILGGVEIPHSKGLKGHSDADVLSHAVADAVLGAMGEPDIGHYFPPGDPTIKGISSLKILEKCAEIAAERGFRIVNIDASLIAEAPKVKPHAAAMKEKIAAALAISPGDIGIKATTNERLGFVGREEGIAAMAVAVVERQ
jgi:2-C-methyl-D-erythritol 2,4-cyclodiphosphate synthase